MEDNNENKPLDVRAFLARFPNCTAEALKNFANPIKPKMGRPPKPRAFIDNSKYDVKPLGRPARSRLSETPKVTMQIRIAVEVHEAIRQSAAAQNRSMANLVETALLELFGSTLS